MPTHLMPTETITQTPPGGLTSAEVALRRSRGLARETQERTSRSVAEILRANILTRFNFILGVLLAVILAAGEPQDALFGIVLVTNALIGIGQELRAKLTLDRLAVVSAPKVRAIRDGAAQEIAVAELVAGDLVDLRAGDQLVADGVVRASAGLQADESLLTGESEPVAKGAGDRLLSGSFVVAGSGAFQATEVGGAAYARQLAAEARRFALVRSELIDGINQILRYVTWAIVPVAALLLISQRHAHDSVREALTGTVAALVGMIPQGLVLLTSVAFGVAAVTLARRHVLVQQLPAVEGLARVDVVCFDKTGTLTDGTMAFDALVRLDDRAPAEAALGALADEKDPNPTLAALGRAFPPPDEWVRQEAVPFSSARKWSAASFAGHGTWILGAPEMVLPRGEQEHLTQAARLAASGRRVLALAWTGGPLDGETIPQEARPVAFVLLAERLRPDAAETIAYFTSQGVALKVISGDSPHTVSAVAARAGLPQSGDPVDARELPEDLTELGRLLEDRAIFGRVTPHQKETMVKTLQARGHTVAMTGDGVNDVLALKLADLGIAVASGAPATKAVAELVLLDGRFATLPSVVAEGRRVTANIERVANLFITKTVWAALLAVAAGAALLPFPFLPRHLTIIDTLAIGIPSFFLALAPNTRRYRPGFVSRVLRFAIPAGGMVAASALAAYALARANGLPLVQQRTAAALVTLVLSLCVLALLAIPLTWRRVMLLGAAAAGFALLFPVPAVRNFYALDLPRAGLGFILLIAALGSAGLAGFCTCPTRRRAGPGTKVPGPLAVGLWAQATPGVMLGSVDAVRRRSRLAWLARAMPVALLAVTTSALAVGGVLHLAGAGYAGDAAWLAVAVCGAVYALWAMADALRHRRLGVDVIALLAVVGAAAVGELLAAAVISVMLASGRALEAWAAGRAEHDLRALLERAPRTARRYAGDSIQTVELEAIVPGDLLLVAPGELVPVDGTLAGTPAILDESALTGEPRPVERAAGQPVRSGVVNAGDAVDLRATATAQDSTYAGIVRLVSEAERSQAPFVRLADRYALWFLGVSLAAAGIAWVIAGPARAVAVLVVATPCPLILAAPVALVSGLSVAARRGVVVKGGAVLERLARCTTLLIDKTGTLTSGRPSLAAVVPAGQLPASEVLSLAASLDQVSPHVLASAIVGAAHQRHCELVLPDHVEEVPGQGIRGSVAGHRVAVGKAAWVGLTGTPAWAKTARRRARLDGALTVFVAADGQPAGVLLLDDPVRPDAGRTIRALRSGGIKRIVMVTGDRAEVADTVGAVIGVDEVLAERTPAEKLDAVRVEHGHAPTIMVGDGINDAPALALADVGVAMGAHGSAASTEAADAVLTVDRLERLGEAAALARRTQRIARQSALAGIAMSLAAMGVAAAGLLPAVWGALLQELIDVAVILNALRALSPGEVGLRLGAPDAALARRFQAEHESIRASIGQLRVAADALGSAPPAAAMDQVHRAYQLLTEQIGPHEQAEEQELYPALNRLLGGSDATATMSRAHAEIAHQIRRLGQLLSDIGTGTPDDVDVADLRSLLYGLHAILRLHTIQEDENYLSLGDDDQQALAPANQ